MSFISFISNTVQYIKSVVSNVIQYVKPDVPHEKSYIYETQNVKPAAVQEVELVASEPRIHEKSYIYETQNVKPAAVQEVELVASEPKILEAVILTNVTSDEVNFVKPNETQYQYNQYTSVPVADGIFARVNELGGQSISARNIPTGAQADIATTTLTKSKANSPMAKVTTKNSEETFALAAQEEEFVVAYGRNSNDKAELINACQETQDYYAQMLQQEQDDAAFARQLQQEDAPYSSSFTTPCNDWIGKDLDNFITSYGEWSGADILGDTLGDVAHSA